MVCRCMALDPAWNIFIQTMCSTETCTTVTYSLTRAKYHGSVIRTSVHDWGSAAWADIFTTIVEPSRVGSARWAASERLDGSKPHPSGDIYSFGCIMFEVLSGEVPWKEKTDWKIVALKPTTQEFPRACGNSKQSLDANGAMLVRSPSATTHSRRGRSGAVLPCARAAVYLMSYAP